MRTKTLILLTWGLTLLGVPASTPAQDPAAERVPITDPALLESLGFPPDATNVYALPQALRHMAMSPVERAADEELLATTETARLTGPYGTDSFGVTTVSYREFRPRISEANFRASYDSDPLQGLRCEDGTSAYDAQFDAIPHGVRLINVRLYAYDTSPESLTAWLYETCQDGPDVAPTLTLLAQGTTVGTPGYTGLLLSAGGVTVNNLTCEYSLRVQLDDSHVWCTEGFRLRIHKARAAWQRQISPAPSQATFDDVPTDHLFFRHIEALATSGITGGCGNGDFCPDAPLTRAQMAAFLATALGLHWGVF